MSWKTPLRLSPATLLVAVALIGCNACTDQRESRRIDLGIGPRDGRTEAAAGTDGAEEGAAPAVETADETAETAAGTAPPATEPEDAGTGTAPDGTAAEPATAEPAITP